MKRLLVVLAILGTFAACSEGDLSTNKPSSDEILDEGTWVEHETPDGDSLWCFYYAEDGSYASWQVFTCVPRKDNPS